MSELTEVRLPADQSEGSTQEVGSWLKQVGDSVRKDEPLLEIITDKVTVEIAAPASGVLEEILKQPGEPVGKGEVLGRIRAGAGSDLAAPALRPPDRLTDLSPAVRRLIQQHGLDPSKIPGSGAGGRITVQDVEGYLGGQTDRGTGGPRGQGLIPHSPIRRSIAEHMVRSVAAAPHVTAVFEADLSRVTAHRRALGEQRPTYTAYFVQAAVAALREVPEVNARWHDEGLELFADCNIGIAVALETGGLIVPVLHRAQELDLAETARRLEDLTRRARDGKLEPREVQGGTFTISNHGVSGSLLAAPIVIVQPQSAILGIGKIEPRARVMESGAIEARPMAYVTLTIDHRALDGLQANSFLAKWVEVIEGWS